MCRNTQHTVSLHEVVDPVDGAFAESAQVFDVQPAAPGLFAISALTIAAAPGLFRKIVCSNATLARMFGLMQVGGLLRFARITSVKFAAITATAVASPSGNILATVKSSVSLKLDGFACRKVLVPSVFFAPSTLRYL